MKRIARMRRWLLGGVVLLLLVLAGLLGYARYRAHRFLANIPRRLGIDIKSETNGFTLSQSSKGHTLFTVHAAKAIQRENGKTTLHDVAITLYGPQGSKRTDSIRGDEFEYDQPNGIVRATGDVYLDLAAPAANGTAPKPNAKRIAVTTRGLVFLQKLGVAATDEPIQIMYGDMHGGATGADYESDTGVLRLRKDVRLDGTQNGRAVHMDAAAAELDRGKQIAMLHSAHVHSNGNTSWGDRIILTLAKNGGIQAVDAEGNVALQGQSGVHGEAARLHARVNDAGRLQTVTMTGGTRFRDGGNTASATDAVLHFNSAGQPEQADLQHAVRIDSPASSSAGHSMLTADHVTAHLQANGKRTEMRDAVATGNAEYCSIEAASSAPLAKTAVLSSPRRASTRTTVVRASMLHAVTAVADGTRYVSVISGYGGTRIDDADDLGNTRSSSGDTLEATLLPQAKGARRAGSGALQNAVQTGHVVVTQHTVAVDGAAGQAGRQPQDSRAAADRAEFDSASQRLILTGAPVVTAPGVQLAADRITLPQAGDVEAQGSLKGTLVQQDADGRAEPVHVTADHASIAGSGGTARFFGSEKPVRMWSSTAQLQAPEVDLDRGKDTLAAHTGAVRGPAAVRLVLPATSSPSTKNPVREGGTVLVTGRDMLMTGATTQAPGHIDFTDDVRVVTIGSDLRARHVVATLKPASKPVNSQAKSAGSALNGGSIDTIVATGDVHLQQPGRTGTGDRLLYTEADGRYQLTGTPVAPPTVVDSLRGSIRGTTLIFHGDDDSVEVAGETGRRVRTETHAARPVRSR